MVVRKMAVDVGKQQVVLAGQACGELFDDGAGGAVARVPADAEGAAREALDQPVDLGVDDVDALRRAFAPRIDGLPVARSEEHKSQLQSLMRIYYAVLCLKKKI